MAGPGLVRARPARARGHRGPDRFRTERDGREGAVPPMRVSRNAPWPGVAARHLLLVSLRTVKFTSTGKCPQNSMMVQMVVHVPRGIRAIFVAFCPVLHPFPHQMRHFLFGSFEQLCGAPSCLQVYGRSELIPRGGSLNGLRDGSAIWVRWSGFSPPGPPSARA